VKDANSSFVEKSYFSDEYSLEEKIFCLIFSKQSFSLFKVLLFSFVQNMAPARIRAHQLIGR
jgi:hypothetical protein